MISERAARVNSAWACAYSEIGAAVAAFVARFGSPGACFDEIAGYAPILAAGIAEAEREAEAASVSWLDGGPGGVQAKIDRWAKLWREALEVLALAR